MFLIWTPTNNYSVSDQEVITYSHMVVKENGCIYCKCQFVKMTPKPLTFYSGHSGTDIVSLLLSEIYSCL